ncbi:MAG: hypothetical protein H6624_03925 [Bdellovibrionaceae bacterium]|nr:hypothetical protein [Bdellovibrionales bacterium]MCB9083462.1 hypothetical protein [Pseudobdellovibrionaceae bacterium]
MEMMAKISIIAFVSLSVGISAMAGGNNVGGGGTVGAGRVPEIRWNPGMDAILTSPDAGIQNAGDSASRTKMYSASINWSKFAGYVLDEKALANGEIAFMGEVKVKPQSGARVIMWPNPVLDQAWDEIYSGKVEVPAHFGPSFKHSNWWNNVVDTTGQLKTAKDGDVVIAFREQVLEAIRRNEKPSVFVMPKDGISTVDIIMFYKSGSDQLIKFNQLHGIGQQK